MMPVFGISVQFLKGLGEQKHFYPNIIWIKVDGSRLIKSHHSSKQNNMAIANACQGM